MMYARIDLSKTNYEVIPEYKKLKLPIPRTLEAIYNAYCKHKKFKSVMPIFDEEYYDDKNEVFGYYNKEADPYKTKIDGFEILGGRL